MLIEIHVVVEHQSCNVNNDCCVKQNVKDCDLECVTNFRKLIRKNVTETRGMNMKPQRKLHIEDSATNKKLGKCLPRGKINQIISVDILISRYYSMDGIIV